MHDPMVVAFDIRRPWPRRDGLPPDKLDRRWAIRHYHRHGLWCADNDCIGEGHKAFPWWRPGSYSVFWTLAGRRYYWPSLLTVWHVEPGGRDALEVCGYQRDLLDGHKIRRRHWQWHVHHWRIQVRPLQALRRWALTRCTACGGPSRKGRYVNLSMQWDRAPGHWWRGERGLYHMDCGPDRRAA